jgi:hypothetical protein
LRIQLTEIFLEIIELKRRGSQETAGGGEISGLGKPEHFFFLPANG